MVVCVCHFSGVAQVTECLLSKSKALSSNPLLSKKIFKKGGREEGRKIYFLVQTTQEVKAEVAIMAPTGLSSYCTLKLLFSKVTVLPRLT
jgi:hypothetical protein